MLMTHLLAPSGNVWLGSVTLTPSRASRRKMCPACAQCWFRSSRPRWFAEGKAQPTLQMQYLTLLREAVFAVIGLIMFKCFLLFCFWTKPHNVFRVWSLFCDCMFLLCVLLVSKLGENFQNCSLYAPPLKHWDLTFKCTNIKGLFKLHCCVGILKSRRNFTHLKGFCCASYKYNIGI